MGKAYRQIWTIAGVALIALCGLVATSYAEGTGSPLLDEATEAQ